MNKKKAIFIYGDFPPSFQHRIKYLTGERWRKERAGEWEREGGREREEERVISEKQEETYVLSGVTLSFNKP